ncbi:glycoside hydrolase family 15 [Cellulomonas sp. NPDC055163]
MPARRLRRAAVPAVVAAVTLLLASSSVGGPRPYAEPALRTQAALLSVDDVVVAVGPDEEVARFEGSNVTATVVSAAGEDARGASERHAELEALAETQRDWLDAGTVPGPEQYADMARQALLDLDTLTLDNGAVLAGPTAAWLYSWPRDASFVAVALARTGHADDAARILGHLARVQEADGTFQARYLPDESGVPDARGTQLDGGAWYLWAAAEWYAAADDQTRAATLDALAPSLTNALAAIEAAIDPVTGMPRPSPDYWEVRETRTTLGVVAPMLRGARAARELAQSVAARGAGAAPGAAGAPDAGTGQDAGSAPDAGTATPDARGAWATAFDARAASVEAMLDRALATRFAPLGYPRHDGGDVRDAAVAFLMPPFAPGSPDVTAAWLEAADGMARPAGGLAPGAGWKADGISWTPQTALFALTAAGSGRVDDARSRLDWLDAHRTDAGSLPEKVLWDGRPADLAPLAWTASLVLLTLDELDAQG